MMRGKEVNNQVNRKEGKEEKVSPETNGVDWMLRLKGSSRVALV